MSFSLKSLVLLIALALLAAGQSGSQVRLWSVDSLVKVFPDDTPPGGLSASDPTPIARNGHASVQFALRSTQREEGLTVEMDSPEREGASLQTEIRRVGYVPVGSHPKNSPADELVRRALGPFPDPLLHNGPFTLEPGQSQAVWITVYAPSGSRPGEYRGNVRVRSGARILADSPFAIQVAPAAVPDTRTLKVTNWFTLDQSGLVTHYPQLKDNSELYWQFLANLGKVLADHRQNVIITPLETLTDRSIVDGRILYGFDRLDRWVELFEKAGVIGTIEGSHLLGRVSGFNTSLVIPSDVIEEGKIVRKNLEPGDPRAEHYLDSYLSALYAHIKEKGWTNRYIQHIHDEPHGKEVQSYNRYAGIIRRNLPGIPTLDAVSLDQNIDFFKDMVDIWVPVLGSFDKRMSLIQSHVKGGGQSWYYTCIGPQGRYLNRFIDYSLLKVRLLHWFNYRHGFTGFLHWGGNYWSPDAFQNVQPIINDGETLLPAGDNAIVYPDPENLSVLSSIRFEAMREGIEDYELLISLARKNSEKAEALVKSAIPNFTDYIRDPAAFRKLQRDLYAQSVD